MIVPGFGFDNFIQTGGPSLGEFLEGGYYLGAIDIGGITYSLIVAPKSGGEATGQAWGPTALIGATSEIDGAANTAAIVAASGTFPAGEFCDGLSLNGYSDWYLPSLDELKAVIDVLRHGYETALCAGYAAILTTAAASASRAFCSALI